MVKCPNCGRETESDPCQWCNYSIPKDDPENRRKSYPIIFGRPLKRSKAGGQTRKKTEESKEAKQLAKEQAKKEKEEAKKAKRLAKEQAKQKAEEAKRAEQLQKEQAGDEAEELKKTENPAKELDKEAAVEVQKAPRETIAPAAIEAEQVKAEKTEAPSEEEVLELYEGITELLFPSPVNLQQIRTVEEQLKKIKEISLLWSGGSEEGAAIAIKTPKPVPLIAILQKIPLVEQAQKDKKAKKITVTLKAT